MTRTERYANLAGVVVPLLGVATAIVLLWNRAVDATDLAILAVMYLITAFGITIGFHRLLTHKAFQTKRWLQLTFAVCGSLSVEGSVMDWVADHRKHHAFPDQEGDPHSPHAGHGAGVRGALAGLWHAHVGWLWRTQGEADARQYAPELREDSFMRAIHRHYHLVVLATLGLPFFLGLVVTGTWQGALTALLWGGLVRVAALHHITWSINSVCHFFGRRRFALDDHSTNVTWLALPSLGEAWHHNHHAFARSAFHGLNRWEAALDPSGWVIRTMRRTGLAWNVVEITHERQSQREVAVSA